MIRKSNYENMDWLNALAAMQKPRDPESDISSQNEADVVANALESSAQIAFQLPVKEETKYEALVRASKEIADKQAMKDKMAAADEIRNKMASNGIDPVALGINVRGENGSWHAITKEEWESSSDVRYVEHIATKAAIEYEKQLKTAWEKESFRPATPANYSYDPETMKDGKIMSAAAMGDNAPRFGNTPSNAASIFDPFKLDKFAAAENEHDKSIKASKEKQKARTEEKKAQYKFEDPGVEPMKSGQIQKSGGEDRDVFVQRVPSNQVSMLDTFGQEKMSSEEIKTKLASMFSAKIPDSGEGIRKAADERKASIQRKEEKDRSWDAPSKPVSTSDIAKRLADLWMPKKP